jgi:hypothetical protein
VRHAPFLGLLLLLHPLACGGAGSGESCPDGHCPQDGGGHADSAPDVAADVGPGDAAPDRTARDSSKVSDGSDDGAPHDARDRSDVRPREAASEASQDAGPPCGTTPTLIANARFWKPDGATSIEAPSVALSATDVYYVLDFGAPCFADGGCSGSEGSIWSVPKGGGVSTVVVRGFGYITTHFVTTSTHVIFGAYETPGSSLDKGYIYSVPLGGGTPTKLATAVGGAGFVATDGTDVYFNDNDGVKKVALSGGSVDTLVTEEYFSFAPVAGSLILADFSNNRVESLSLDGGARTTLATNQVGPLYPVGCLSSFCWANAGDEIGGGGLPGGEGDIVQLLGGSATAISTSPSLFEPTGMTYDGDDFFVTAGGGPFGNLLRVPGTGGPPVNLATFSGSNGSAVDDLCVYWADPLGGVYSLIKSSAGGFSVR